MSQTTATPRATATAPAMRRDDFRRAGGGLEQLSSEAGKERPQQPFDHENEADGNDEIAHGAAQVEPAYCAPGGSFGGARLP